MRTLWIFTFEFLYYLTIYWWLGPIFEQRQVNKWQEDRKRYFGSYYTITILLLSVNTTQAVDYSVSSASVNYNVNKTVSYDLNPMNTVLAAPRIQETSKATIQSPIYQEQTTVTYRSPIGHTHTCIRCGDVWDHNKNPGHNCQNCGSAQFTQDRIPKLVPVLTKTHIQTTPTVIQQPLYTLPSGIYNGCTTGNCPINRR